jgi:hypothetical protein
MATLTQQLAAFMRESLPAVISEAKDLGRESVQTVVWLVGLATGLITLIAAHPEIISPLTIFQRRMIIAGLCFTITFGLAQRIFNQLAERRERDLFFRLQGHLAAYGLDVVEPDELENRWTQNEILERLRRDFDSDVTVLADLGLPIELYRTLYSRHVELWHEQQSRRLNDLLQVLAAYGMYDPSTAMMSQADTLRPIRRIVSRIKWLRRGALWSFIVACVTFLFSLFWIVYAILP